MVAITMSDDLDTTTIRKAYAVLRGRYEGEDRRSERRQERTDWVKLAIPWLAGGTILFAQFKVQEYRVERLEKSDSAQWERLGSHLENHNDED